MMNKKGFSLTTWAFGIILVLTFFFILQSQVLTPMNTMYNKSFETGINTSTLDNFQAMRTGADDNIHGGEASQTAYGLSLSSTWAVALSVYDTIRDFFDGSFFATLFGQLNLPPIMATIATLLGWISLIMIIVYLFMRVRP